LQSVANVSELSSLTHGEVDILNGVLVELISSLGISGIVYGVQGQKLSPTFYSQTCPNLIAIVRQKMIEHTSIEPRTPPRLLRMQFHDCGFTVHFDKPLLASLLTSRSTQYALELMFLLTRFDPKEFIHSWVVCAMKLP
jgi:hypothetical protein